ncbi:hypothetical protein LU631_17135 [Erwinia tracheiphila]|uniref:Uncharacterized protein n=1 Tax=Erwinia tracheiphila TaxID=65700 RepID=A0A0M2K6F0_9GAMM|nr:hypothetical protein [Erwinia tracheiphila]EOS96560.1 hypothetical protein ETR_02234 [Erwinia tracheiphila PSU-1]KKF34960.1 hypothetical protein SY86_05215 [Erwinia tracheiphila]UIA86626.1 hypothetical protein LU631_17135 [Erwinia tracheiphila]UIA94979.1 hypothetical protein LU633_15595 [Erwinia tracheiphila]
MKKLPELSLEKTAFKTQMRSIVDAGGTAKPPKVPICSRACSPSDHLVSEVFFSLIRAAVILCIRNANFSS